MTAYPDDIDDHQLMTAYCDDIDDHQFMTAYREDIDDHQLMTAGWLRMKSKTDIRQTPTI